VSEITVHHLSDSRSQRTLWLLEELGVDYELVIHQRNPKTMRAPAALREVHPLGKAPVVVVDGVPLAESGAITETLVEQLGPQLAPPAGTDAARWYRFWMHYAEGSFAPPLLVKLITRRIASAPVPFFLKPVVRRIAGTVDATYTDPELQLHLSFIDGHLGGVPWFCGEAFSAADIQMSFGLEAASARASAPAHGRAAIRGWLDRSRARPAYQRALERGGPYAYAG